MAQAYSLPRAEVFDHPLYLWEVGAGRAWWERLWSPRMLGGVVGTALLVAETALHFHGSALMLTIVSMASYALPAGLFFWMQLRAGAKLIAARDSGLLRDVHLSGRRPLATYGAFVLGTGGGWMWLPCLLAISLGVLTMTAAPVRVRFAFVTAIALVTPVIGWLLQRGGRIKLGATDATWMLTPRSRGAQLVKFAPLGMIWLMWPLFMLTKGGPLESVVIVGFLVPLVMLSLQSRGYGRLSEAQFEARFVAFCTGEEVVERE